MCFGLQFNKFSTLTLYSPLNFVQFALTGSMAVTLRAHLLGEDTLQTLVVVQ